MQLSEEFVTLMKNFSAINPSIVLRKGNTQRIMAANKTILAEAEFADDIPNDFGIYDLNQFLGNVTTMNNPSLTFNTKQVVIKDDVLRLEYMACSPSLIESPPDKNLIMKNVDAKFSITNTTLQKLMKLISMNGFPNLSIVGKDGKIVAIANDRKDDTSNKLSTELSDYKGNDFEVAFKVENFKLIPDDYEIEIMVNGFGKFISKNHKLKYYVGMESK